MYCFGDYWNAESHVAKENAPAEKEKEFGNATEYGTKDLGTKTCTMVQDV